MIESIVSATGFSVQAKHESGEWWTVCTDTLEAAAQATANYLARAYEVETRVVTNEPVEKPVEKQPAPTALEAALLKVQALPDADLYRLAGQHAGTAAACACFLELANRQRARQPRDWADWPWLDNEPNSLREAEQEAAIQAASKPVGASTKWWGPRTDAEAWGFLKGAVAL